MDLLVLGGTQFVGRHVTEAALVAGHAVTLFNRGQTNPGLFPDVRQLVGDRSTSDLDALRTGRWDAVIDVNGYLPRLVRESAELLRGRAGHYTFISSVAVYPDTTQPGADESAPVGSAPPDATDELTAETYGPFKAECERIVAAVFGDRAASVRPGAVVGPHDPTGGFAHWVTVMARDAVVECPASPKQPVQVLDARDLAAFVLRLAITGAEGVFNAVGPTMPFSSFLQRCAGGAGTDAAQICWVDEGTGPFVLPRDGSGHGRFSFASDRARALGLRTRPLHESAADVRDALS